MSPVQDKPTLKGVFLVRPKYDTTTRIGRCGKAPETVPGSEHPNVHAYFLRNG